MNLYQKANSVKKSVQFKPVHTRISFILIIMASMVMLYIGFRHVNDIDENGSAWGQFALIQAFFGLIGYVGTQFLTHQPLIMKEYKPVDINSLLRAAIIYIAAMVTQIVTQYVFTISNTEKALYTVFGSVCEESFFRLFLITMILSFHTGTKTGEIIKKIAAITIQAAIFTAVHQNYYNDPGKLFGVLIGGIILGIFFLIWNDITANILGHFILNMIATWNWLVQLNAETNWPLFIIIFAIIVILFGITLKKSGRIEEWKKERGNKLYCQ